MIRTSKNISNGGSNVAHAMILIFVIETIQTKAYDGTILIRRFLI